MEIMRASGCEPLADYVAEHAPSARTLDEVTAHCGADYHTVWLDGTDVWHAWMEDPSAPSSGWVLEREPAGEALPWIREQLVLVLDRVADPALYEYEPPGLVDSDENAVDELYDVELAAIPGGSHATDATIQRRLAAARAEVGRLSGLRAHHVTARFEESGRGWQSRAATALGVSPAAISNLLADAAGRAAKRRKAAREARR